MNQKTKRYSAKFSNKIETSKLNFMGPFFWRFSLKEFHRYNLLGFDVFHKLNEFIRNEYENDEICEWLDILLCRETGYHRNLLRSKNTAKSRRAIYYTSRLIFSSILKNDTGVKGGISGVPFQISTNKNDPVRKWPIEKYVDLIKLKSNIDSLEVIKKKENKDSYVIPVYMSERLSGNLDWTPVLDTAKKLVNWYENMKNNNGEKYLNFYAIDFFKMDGKWIPFEFHKPGRGLGLHFNSLLHANHYLAGEIFQTIHTIRDGLASRFGNKIKLNIKNYQKTSFHKMDYSFVKAIEEAPKSGFGNADSFVNNVNVDLDYPLDLEMERLPIRELLPAADSLKSIVIHEIEDLTPESINTIIETIGPWVIVKQLRNLPWWHKQRNRPEFELLNSRYGLNGVRRMLKKGPIQIQPIVTDSLDNKGHFGELRVYCYKFT